MSGETVPAHERARADRQGRVRRILKALRSVFVSTTIIGMVVAFVRDVLANKVSDNLDVSFLEAALDSGALWWSIAVLGLLFTVVVLAALWWMPPSPRTDRPVLPPRTELLGRDDLVPQVVAEAREKGVVLVRGPAGSGTSAIAVNAARELTAEMPQRYVDLRGPDPDGVETARRVRIRVLSALGVRPGPFQNAERAAAKVAETLKDTGQVLVLDNVSEYDQVGWAVERVPRAFVIIAGDFQVPEPPRAAADIRVGPLAPKDALELLRRQGGGHRPRRPGVRGILDRLTFPRPHHGSVAARVDAELPAATELAGRHLQSPRVAILVGQWLADNPGITLGGLLAELESGDRGTGNSELLLILRRRLDGASAGARRLLSLLARAPIMEFTEDAATAMAGGSRVRTVGLLKELADRSLVAWIQPSRCRVSPEAMRLADPQRRAVVDRALVRLAAHYAEQTEAWTEALSAGDRQDERTAAADWFRREDVTLLELLRGMAEPPRRAGPQLWRIADGLETWFHREGRLRDRRAAAEGMRSAAEHLGADGPHAVALLRLASAELAAGEFGRAREHLDGAERLDVRAERPQLHTGQAVRHLVVTGDRKAVEPHLDEARRARPRRDGTGQLTDLTNLAVLREDPDVAAEYLDQALSLADDPHAHELTGVLAWRRGHREQAVREWEEAYRLYGRLGDDTGRARCLQHHGTALLTGPGTEAGRDRGREMLVDSLSLRVTDVGIGVALAHLYLGEGARWPGEATRHRTRGLEALAPWQDEPISPDLVATVRARLERLAEW